VRRDPVFPTPALTPGALTGQTVVITGASDGIGFALAEAVAAAGAQVVLVGRNAAKTRHAASVIGTRTGSDRVTVETADLLYLDEQAALAERLRTAHPRLHALVNNAGALFLERQLTRDGLERTFALNHMAYVQLGLRLLPALLSASQPGRPARLINVASRAHTGARLRLDDLQGAHRFSGWSAYANSKLANILFTRALARRIDATALCVHAVHPGLVASRFAANNGAVGRLQRRIMDCVAISNAAGADTPAWLLGSPEGSTHTGGYWVRRARVTPTFAARDDALAEGLWTRSLAIARLEEPVGPAAAR
jgi:retinol dehydrogenase-12